MTNRHFKYEGWLYALAFFIALVVRLVGLGSMPLADAEAAPALQALRLSQSASSALDPHPLYILSTSIFFLMYGGGTNFFARLVPALIGSLFVLTPLLFDDRLKPRPSLILAFFLALDPGLVAISRQAASPIFAITFLMLTAGFINKNKPNYAAVTAALALLSGPSVWFGLLGIGITVGISIILFFRRQPKETPKEETAPEPRPSSTFKVPAFQASHLLTFFLTFIFAGTLFFTAPAGLGAAFSSIPAFLNRWITPSGEITQGITVLSLLIYQPFTLLLAAIALLRGLLGGLRRIIYLSIWWAVAFFLVIFLPDRQMADLAWMLIPLHGLAALELVRHIKFIPDERREVLAVMLLTVFIWLFAWLGLSGINWLSFETPEFRLRAGMLIGAILLLIVSLVLVAAGWSIRIARTGGIWGMAIVLGVLSLGGLFGSTGLRGLNSPEMWWLPQLPLQADLLRDTVSQVSELGTGNDYVASVAIMGVQSPAIEWALRENPMQIVDALDVTSTPDFVITSYEMNPELVSAYRGQDFIWRQTPLWSSADPGSWFRWVTLREMPQTQELIILWARTDLFLDD